ncbi:MAG: 5-(carboxyamino)imidazole ribonucleotide mutase [Desulfohalobiaceae bacterium]|nr:5-(carboxyamino)imidazole ribonucleotide mutase [Desulfohalobiaceae bacterium]
MTQVAVFMGSKSDKEQMLPCTKILDELNISYRFTITSAHRTPQRTENLIRELEQDGCQVFICAAGMAAHLAGAVAARTIKPVLGVPLNASALNGMDALLATVQMPPGFPVGTLALDKAGAKNAAWLAAQILALSDSSLTEKIVRARSRMQDEVSWAAESLAQD